MQTRSMSAVEAVANVLIGYLVSVAANILILPAFGYDVTVSHSFLIGLAFTVVSFARSFILRRAFNWIGR